MQSKSDKMYSDVQARQNHAAKIEDKQFLTAIFCYLVESNETSHLSACD